MSLVETTYKALVALFPEIVHVSNEPVDNTEEDSKSEQRRKHGVLHTEHAARGTSLDVFCMSDQIVEAAGVLDNAGFYLESISGVDWIKEERIEVIYDFNHYGKELCRVVVRLFLLRTHPVVPTLCTVTPAADWHERESHDFYGIQFTAHPNLTPLLLPEDADFHPLLKDFSP